AALLVRLEEDAGRPAQLVTPLAEQQRHADGDGHVRVVAAEVRRAGRRGGVGAVLPVLSRERVELGAVGDGRAGVRAFDLDVEAGRGERAVDLEPPGLELGPEVARRFGLFEPDLRMTVEVAAQRYEEVSEVGSGEVGGGGVRGGAEEEHKTGWTVRGACGGSYPATARGLRGGRESTGYSCYAAPVRKTSARASAARLRTMASSEPVSA